MITRAVPVALCLGLVGTGFSGRMAVRRSIRVCNGGFEVGLPRNASVSCPANRRLWRSLSYLSLWTSDLIGATGFEPVTSCTPSKRANPSCATPRCPPRIGAARGCVYTCGAPRL